MRPYITDEVFPVFLLVEQTPAELIVVALTQLDYQGQYLMDVVIDTLEQFLVMTLRCFFEEENIWIESINQTEFYKDCIHFVRYISTEYFEIDQNGYNSHNSV